MVRLVPPGEAATASQAALMHPAVEPLAVMSGTAEMLLRRAIVALRRTEMVSSAKSTARVMTAKSAATHVVATSTTESASLMTAATHVAATATAPAPVTMTGRQLRAQTQNACCCQRNRHPADPGTHDSCSF